jgi:hypothetical protein
MAKTYTAAGSAVAGDVYTAAAHNVIVTNVNNFIVPPIARVRRATNQSIPNATDTFVSWTIEDIDTDGMFTATSDTITIQTAGVYIVTTSVYFAANATGQRVVNMMKSPSSVSDLAAAFAQSWFPVASATNPSTLSASGVVNCIVGDTIKIVAYQTSGGALNIADTGFSSATQCSIAWIGRTS